MILTPGQRRDAISTLRRIDADLGRIQAELKGLRPELARPWWHGLPLAEYLARLKKMTAPAPVVVADEEREPVREHLRAYCPCGDCRRWRIDRRLDRLRSACSDTENYSRRRIFQRADEARLVGATQDELDGVVGVWPAGGAP